jgi:hypothetical protein
MRWLLLAIVAASLAGCSGAGGDVPAARQANVMSAFKMAASFQFIRLTEREGFARNLAQLKQDGYGARQLDAIVAAQQSGAPIYGYVFKDLVSDERGGSLDTRSRYGLSAVPEKSGAGTSYLMLIDLTKPQVDDGRGPGIGNEVDYYKLAAPQAAFDTWPSSATLAGWERIGMRTPQEALKEATELKQKYDEGAAKGVR